MKTKVEVELWSGLRALAGGEERIEVEAETVGQVLAALKARWPALAETLDEGVSVAVNGQIVTTAWNTPVSPGDEIVLMQRVRGG